MKVKHMDSQPIPEPSDAQRIEAAINNWRRIASDTATVVKVFQDNGFSRSEALELAVVFLTGKSK